MKESAPLCSEQLLKINKQMNKIICVIDLGNSKGTGFFCKIPFPDNKNLLPVLITCNHVLNEEYINRNKSVFISFNNQNERREIIIENRISYTNKEYDITIIEIKSEKDNINNFLELEELDDESLQELPVYLLQYAKGEKCLVSFGIIRRTKETNIIHNCWTDFGSAGSPIISSKNNKVIGVHYGLCKGSSKNSFKLGTLLSIAVRDFQNIKKLNSSKK